MNAYVYPELGTHIALKVPHHGSAAAQHSSLMTPGASRAWLVSPFASQRLPRVFDKTGVRALLVNEASIALTSQISEVVLTTGAVRSGVPIDTIRQRIVRGMESDPFLSDAADVTPVEHDDACAPVWGVALDDRGAIQKQWRGSSALRITR